MAVSKKWVACPKSGGSLLSILAAQSWCDAANTARKWRFRANFSRSPFGLSKPFGGWGESSEDGRSIFHCIACVVGTSRCEFLGGAVAVGDCDRSYSVRAGCFGYSNLRSPTMNVAAGSRDCSSSRRRSNAVLV